MLVEHPVECGPLLVRDRSLEESDVELIDRSGEVLPVVVLINLRLADRSQSDIDRFDDDRQIVDEGAIPIPNHMDHDPGA